LRKNPHVIIVSIIMVKMKSILHLTAEEIKTDALKSDLPELYELQKVYETNAWHNHQQVFTHTLNVFSFLKKYSQNNLLLWAGLLHDIGKKDSIPDHVLIGARKAEKILTRLKFSSKDRDYIVTIVKLHGLTTDLNQAENLRRRYPEIFNDLMIFGLADTQGSHLKQNNPRDYHHRLNFYLSHLSSTLPIGSLDERFGKNVSGFGGLAEPGRD